MSKRQEAFISHVALPAMNKALRGRALSPAFHDDAIRNRCCAPLSGSRIDLYLTFLDNDRNVIIRGEEVPEMLSMLPGQRHPATDSLGMSDEVSADPAYPADAIQWIERMLSKANEPPRA